MVVYFTISSLYLAVSCLLLRFVIAKQNHLLGTKMGRRHPERFYRPIWFNVIVSLLWPLQIIGFLIYLVRGKL